jgi:hypothetical protein
MCEDLFSRFLSWIHVSKAGISISDEKFTNMDFVFLDECGFLVDLLPRTSHIERITSYKLVEWPYESWDIRIEFEKLNASNQANKFDRATSLVEVPRNLSPTREE